MGYTRRIADILVLLQQRGNTVYIGLQLKFPCALPNIVQVLQECADKMETHLKQWETTVYGIRDQFYELNYFTTQQLLLLQAELGSIVHNPDTECVRPEVITLLQSISRRITSELLIKNIQKIGPLLQPIQSTEPSMIDMSTRVKEQQVQSNCETENSNLVMEGLFNLEKTKSSALLPKLKKEDLNEGQRVIYANVLQNLNCDERIVLLAFERCRSPDNEDAIMEWCCEYECDDNNDAEEEENTEEEYKEYHQEEGIAIERPDKERY